MNEVKNRREMQDRIDGCVLELDAHLHPQNGKNPYRAAVLQGWIYALSWAIENDNPYNRSEEIKNLLQNNE